MAEGKKEKRKTPVAKEKKIKDVNKKDARVKITGTVIGKNENANSIKIDDGTGKVTVLLESEQRFEEIGMEDFIRIIGSVLAFDEGFEIKADVIQDFSEVDKELYKKVESVLRNQKKINKEVIL